MSAVIEFVKALMFLFVFFVVIRAVIVYLQYRQKILEAEQLIRSKKQEEKENAIRKSISDQPLDELVKSGHGSDESSGHGS